MEQLIGTVALVSLIFAFVNFLKYLRNTDWNAAGTQVIVWVAGCAAIAIAAHTQWSVQIFSKLLGTDFAKLSTVDQLWLGLNAGSIATTYNEIKKAFDGSDTAQTPKLFPPST